MEFLVNKFTSNAYILANQQEYLSPVENDMYECHKPTQAPSHTVLPCQMTKTVPAA
jgi:hypothetical protein